MEKPYHIQQKVFEFTELPKIMRKGIIQFRIYRGEKYYVAECLDLPIVTQGKTLDEVIENIKEAIELHLEGEDLEELGISPHFSVLINMELDLVPVISY